MALPKIDDSDVLKDEKAQYAADKLFLPRKLATFGTAAHDAYLVYVMLAEGANIAQLNNMENHAVEWTNDRGQMITVRVQPFCLRMCIWIMHACC